MSKQIDPRGPRFGAAITTLVLAATLVAIPSTAATVLLGSQTVVFALGAFVGLHAQPYGILYRKLVAPKLGKPTELEAANNFETAGEIKAGELSIDESTYSAKLRGRTLDLTFKEFELLKFLAQHPGRVFSRDQLLSQVWGYDYFGGTRTVDVHVRRLRAKLGPENENLIGTVRNVGYRYVTSPVTDSESHEVLV